MKISEVITRAISSYFRISARKMKYIGKGFVCERPGSPCAGDNISRHIFQRLWHRYSFCSRPWERELLLLKRQSPSLILGYFLGKLGRTRVAALYKGVELPSDYSGILYTQFDEHGAWRFKLAKELKTAGYDIDLNML